jgi:NIMA (never in mitosis gene a)-related kinase
MWSVGLIIYELITLHHAFSENKENLMRIIWKTIVEEPIAIKDKLCNVEFRKLVMSLLNKNPEERPTAKELKTTLLLLLEKKRKKEMCSSQEVNMNVVDYDMMYPPSLITGNE